MKIKIHKHTPVRYKMSYWVTRVEVMVAVRNTSKGMFDPLSPLVTDITKKLPEIENFDWIGWTTGHTPRAEGTFDNITWHTPYKPLTTWQNIKYHIIWWKK